MKLFTGKRAFDKQQDTTPTRPSSWVTGINPSVERVILKCFEKEPKARPASALAVRGALPGGDPLAAVIAAGETLAPELVAEGGAFEGLTRRTAWIALIAGLAGIGLAAYLASQTQLGALTPLPKAPAVLVDDAREVLEGLGYASATRDSAQGFYFDCAYIDSFYEGSTCPSDWNFLRTTQPSAVRFWYRESPSYLLPYPQIDFVECDFDPPSIVPGMVRVELDPEGRLRGFEAVPLDEDAASSTADPDWG